MPSSQTPSIAGTAIDPTSVRPDIADAEIARIAPADLRDTIAALRLEGFSMLLDIGGVDYLGREPRYDVVYHLLALPAKVSTVAEIGSPRRKRLLVGVPESPATLPSIQDIWPNANWAEREIYDLFGITFDGHPQMTRIQLPHEWEGHPLRKDYPLRGPAREATPRPAFALKSNVPAGTPPSGKVAAALQQQIARARGIVAPPPAAPDAGGAKK